MIISFQQTRELEHEVVVGVDTHKDFHVAAVLNISGGLLGTRSLLEEPRVFRTGSNGTSCREL